MEKKQVQKHRFIPLLLVVFGAISLFLLVFFTDTFLSFITRRGWPLSSRFLTGNLGDIRFGLIASGLILIILGWISFRMDLFSFLHDNRSINAALLILTLGWIAITAEIALKLLPLPSSETYISYAPSSFSVHQFSREARDLKNFDGELQAVLRNGYRGKAFPVAKRKGETRIVFLGGSFVFDYNAGPGRDWPHRIEEILRDRGYSNVTVINAGTPGHHTFDSVGRLYSEIHCFEPDYVVICHSWNDIKYFREVSPDSTLLELFPGLGSKNYSPGRLGRLLEKSRIYLLLKWTLFSEAFWNRMTGPEGKLPEGEYLNSYSPWAVRQLKLNFQMFADACHNIGAEPVLFTQPRLVSPTNTEEEKEKIWHRIQLLSHSALCQAFEDCDSTARTVARRKNARFFDLAAPFTGKSEFFSDHVHLSDLGSSRVAEAAADYLQSLIDADSGASEDYLQPPIDADSGASD